MRYKTIIEVITDGDDADEALDKAGEYLRGASTSDIPLKVKTQSLNKRNYGALGYTIGICFLLLMFGFSWFSVGRTYQEMASNRQKAVETYAVHPPMNTDMTQKNGKDFKKKWDELYKKKILHGADENINSR